MTSGAQTPTLKVTKETRTSSLDDVTERERTPVEDAFYESFLLQSRSDIENLYASNIYWSQKHSKEVKDLDRQKIVSMCSMTKEQKEMIKKMNKLQQKQEKIFEEKRQKLLSATGQNGRRMRPQSTSAMPNDLRTGKHRVRSGSMPFLDPLELPLGPKHLSKSSENLFDGSPNRLRVNSSNQLSKSCENLSTLDNVNDKSSNKVVLPAIERSQSSEAIDDRSEDESTFFITKVPVAQPSPPTKPKQSSHFLKPVGFDPHRRRGSLPNPAELERQLNLERRRGSVEIGDPLQQGTQAKWVPRMAPGRALPPI